MMSDTLNRIMESGYPQGSGPQGGAAILLQLVPYLILTAAEVLISTTGLEFAFREAAPEMKSTIMSFWLLTVFAGNIFTAFIAKLNRFEGASQFLFFALAMFAVSGVFILSAWLYKERNYVESDHAKQA